MLKTIWADDPAIHLPNNTPSGGEDDTPELEGDVEDDGRPVHRGPAWDLSVIRAAASEIDSNDLLADDDSIEDEAVRSDDGD